MKSYLERPHNESRKTRNIKAIWDNASLTSQGPLNEKERQSIEKDISKGIVPKKLKNHYKIHGYNCLRKIDSLSNFVNSTYPNSLYEELGWNEWVAPQEIYHDTIPNPVLAKVSESKIIDGWEWLRKGDYEEVTDSYPYSVEYLKFKDYPQYKVCKIDIPTSENVVYSKNGELVYVSGIGNQYYVDQGYIYRNNLDRNSVIGRQFANFAYEQNDYDIKSQSAKINHYIKNQLGLEEMTAAEKKQMDRNANAMASAMLGHAKSQMQHGNSRKGQRQQRNYAGKFMGALLGGSNSYYSPEGSSWFNQIEEDIWKLLSDDGIIKPLKAKRLDEKTFVYYYGNKNGEVLYKITYGFNGTKPFEYEFTAKVEKYNPKNEPKESYAKLDNDHAVTFNFDNQAPSSEGHPQTFSSDKIYSAVEQMPIFPGGENALQKWIGNNMRYPAIAVQNGIEGRVLVMFVVEKDGSVSNPKIVRGKDSNLDNEAIRIVRTLPKFTPARMNGKEVRCYYNVPITFRIR